MTEARRFPGTTGIAADWLSLAAAPTFAAMALLTGALGGDAPGTMCLPAHASPLTGMAAMYLLMCGFHAAPWLRLIASLGPAVGSRASAVGGEASRASLSPTPSAIHEGRPSHTVPRATGRGSG